MICLAHNLFFHQQSNCPISVWQQGLTGAVSQAAELHRTWKSLYKKIVCNRDKLYCFSLNEQQDKVRILNLQYMCTHFCIDGLYIFINIKEFFSAL